MSHRQPLPSPTKVDQITENKATSSDATCAVNRSALMPFSKKALGNAIRNSKGFVVVIAWGAGL
jgi:hypothetical protein